ncbi:hypothetical protein IB229_02530 [Pseudomonas sp. PDM14]|uniref:hypothetical protein n=1 Tax=Pseudomonas sp. PDM14 TaxID=2769288 RepID=UPI0017854439|nr:hypothetical protein [Pseudomonas sp. PDM14]MBD9481832.1 hypothetical protein [Pseudomonas sp. PDM14]
MAVDTPNATPCSSQTEYPPEIGRVCNLAFFSNGSLNNSSKSSATQPAMDLALLSLLSSIEGGFARIISTEEHPENAAMLASKTIREILIFKSPNF